LTARNPQTPSDISGAAKVGRRLGRLIDRMRGNPAADWRIEDVQKVCRQVGLTCSPPNGGSHYKVSSHFDATILTIPARKPIKVVYIKLLMDLVNAHLDAGSKEQEAAHGSD
jgi:hypothetical protein